MATRNVDAAAKTVQLRVWTWISAALFAVIHLLIVGLALFDHLTKGQVSNEGAAGLSLLAMLPAVPGSIVLFFVIEDVGADWLLAPFDTGLANVSWIAAMSWLLAVAQWGWAIPRLLIAFYARK